MNFADLAAFIAAGSPFILQFLNFLKFLRSRDWNGVSLAGGSWVMGVGLAFLFANSDFAGPLGIEGLNGYTLVIAGVSLGSIASTGYDALKSVDNSQSAAKPALVTTSSDPKF